MWYDRNGEGKCTKPMKPVCSEVIYDAKAKKELQAGYSSLLKFYPWKIFLGLQGVGGGCINLSKKSPFEFVFSSSEFTQINL